MATACAEIVCSADCETELPEVSFDECNPDIHFGQISAMFITNIGNPLSDETDPAEWSARMSASGASKIIEIIGIGSKAAAESNVIEISKGRRVTGNKNHSIAFKVDEVSDLNYEMHRKFECGKTVLAWYKTLNGKLYGGNKGIKMSIVSNHVIPENSQELETIEFNFTWKSKFHPCRTDYPLQDAGS